MKKGDVITLYVRGCSVCGENHQVEFHRLCVPIGEWEYVGECKGRLIRMKYITEDARLP